MESYQNFPQKHTKHFCKISENGELNHDFLADVEDYFLPPRRPVDRCDELQLAGGLISCGERSGGRSFHAFCRKMRLNHDPYLCWLRRLAR